MGELEVASWDHPKLQHGQPVAVPSCAMNALRSDKAARVLLQCCSCELGSSRRTPVCFRSLIKNRAE